MERFVSLAVLMMCWSCLLGSPTSKYTTKYDSLDIDEILNNDRLYRKYFLCLTGEGRCTPDGKELKENLPEAVATGCAKCTSHQREGSEKVLRHLIEKRPEDWAKLEKIFDPVGVYRRRYRDQIILKGIRLELVTEPTDLPTTTIIMP